MKNQSKLCPSSRFTKGASLLGIKNEKGEMDILKTPIKITTEIHEQFSTTVAKPEKTLRFVNKCVQSGCKQWTGTKCGVIDSILERVEEQYVKDNLPECSIRETCRWYDQNGSDACKVCPLVTTYTEFPFENKFIKPKSPDKDI